MTTIARRVPGAGTSRLIAAPERVSGMPARFVVPMLTAGIALQVAVLGMYWDVAYHIDHGRDQAIFTLPHTLIVLGLQGIFASAVLHGLLKGPKARGERRLGPLSLAPGGAIVLLCSTIALIGFPLDDVWHRLFGEDVTLWGPTHLFMIGGAGFSTLGLWMLHRHGAELGRPPQARQEGRTAHRGRAADRPVHVPGGVRLRRPAVPAALPADPDRVRRRPRAGRRTLGARPLGRRARAGDLLRHPRRAGADRRPGDGLHDAALPALRRRGAGRRGRRARSPGAARCASRCSPGRASARSASAPSGSGATCGWRTRGRRRCCPRR